MRFIDFLIEDQQNSTKPPKRPKVNLKFKNPNLWAQDIKIEKGDFDVYKDIDGNLYAADSNGEFCYGKWLKKQNTGISFYKAKPFRIYQHKRKKLQKVKKV